MTFTTPLDIFSVPRVIEGAYFWYLIRFISSSNIIED
jgi:hypothetical protein